MQHRVTLHKGTALNVLAAHTHIGAFYEQRAKGQKLAHAPIDLAVCAHLNALFTQFLELLVNRETLGNFTECFCDVLEGILTKREGGSGVLLGGVPGVPKGKVTIIGGGVVGTHAARIALGLGAQVTILDISAKRLSVLEDVFGHQIQTLMSNPFNIEASVREADVVIGAVLIPGAKAPKLVTDDMVKQMRPGSVIVDVAVDQGGVIETADRVTTHTEPVYEKHGVLHYAVANIPGAVARTSTIALTNVTLPYVEALAGKGFKQAIADDKGLRQGVTTYQGHITSQPVAEGLNKDYTSIDELV